MWFAGMTNFRAVYVFNSEDHTSLHAREFLHLLPGAVEIGDGNVRSRTFLKSYECVVTVAAPEGVDEHKTLLSRIFFGFQGETKEAAIGMLRESLREYR